MVSVAYDELAVICFLDGNCGAHVTTLVSPINGYQVVATSAVYADFNRCAVAHNQWTRTETVWRNRGQCQYAGLRCNDWTANAQGVAGGTRRCCHNESVGLVGNSVATVDGGLECDH